MARPFETQGRYTDGRRDFDVDRKHGFGWFWLALLAGLWLPTVAAAAPAAEQRCTELGGSCMCSEPMNWQQAGGGAYGGRVNPSDSAGSGAKECGPGGSTADWDDPPNWRSVPVPNKPAGAASSWQYAQQVTHVAADGDNVNWWYGVPASTSNGTICTRHYTNIGTLAAMTSHDHRLKVAQFSGNVANLTQLEWAWDESSSATQHLRPQAGTNFRRGNVVTFQDCRGAWCRIEYCVDYNGGRPSYRVRISKVGVPAKTEIITDQQQNPQPAPLSFDSVGVAIGDIFAQCYGRNPCPTGTRHVAFGIQTLVQPMNSNFWPGAAYEVEGGSDGSTPPPPTTPPPPPAESLGKPGTPTYQP